MTLRSSLLLYCNRSDAEFALLTNCRFLLFQRVVATTTAITHQTRWRYATAQLACICCMHPGTPSGPESSRLFSLTSNSHYIYSIVYVCSLTDCKLLYPSGLVAHTNCMFNLLRITIIPIMVMYSMDLKIYSGLRKRINEAPFM